ncbi:MAG TPA: membrane protein insertase YidC [Alphaproteobacteria bacterium]
MQIDQKNLIIAIALSIAIVLGFEFFYNLPRIERQKALEAERAATQAQTEATAPAPSAAPSSAAPAAASNAPTPPAAAPVVPPAQQPRVRIETTDQSGKKVVTGSIRLAGGRIDDIRLEKYRETPDPNSPPTTLLAPQGTPEPYFAEFGWVAARPGVKAPDENTLWAADRQTLTADQPVTLSWDNGEGLRFQRVYAIDQGYMITVTQRVVNSGPAPVEMLPYGLVSRQGTPPTSGYYILHEGPLGVFDGRLSEYNYKDLVKKPNIDVKSTGGWIGITDKYWLVALIPDQKASVTSRFKYVPVNNTDRYQVDYLEAEQTIAPGATAETITRLFAGAKEVKLIDRYASEYNIDHFELAIDWGWFKFLTRPIFMALDYLNALIGNFGLAILLLTVVIKGLFFPLANRSYRAMSKMKLLQPEMEKLREKYGEDKQRLSQEMMGLYKKHGANPVAGCLPIAIQIPVFFALYKDIFITIEMRHAPFYGWIHDLSSADPTSLFNLFGLLPISPPEMMLLGHTLGAWPLIMGLTMFMQQKLNPQPPDPVQAKIFLLMPIFFTFLLASFPAGLVIYWAWNNLLSIAQQWVIMKRMGAAPTLHHAQPAKATAKSGK